MSGEQNQDSQKRGKRIKGILWGNGEKIRENGKQGETKEKWALFSTPQRLPIKACGGGPSFAGQIHRPKTFFVIRD